MEDTVAFTAAYDSERQLQPGDTLDPKKVLTNQGNGYDSSTGNFIAPTSGIYLFEFHALTAKNNSLWLKLYHNNDYVISAWARNNGDYDAAGNTAILRLKKGDKVYLQACGITSLYGKPDDIYTTFSGYRIGLLADCDDA